MSGSTRATGYYNSNKIVTSGTKTHVAYLAALPTGFEVHARTRDIDSGAWSPVTIVGAADDNHGGPALAMDGRQYLHVAFGPHDYGPIRYRAAVSPNDATLWGPEERFGGETGATYPVLSVAPDDSLVLTCRGRYLAPDVGPGWIGRAEWWTKRPQGGWVGPTALLRSRFPGYSAFSECLVWGPGESTLQLVCTFHEDSDLEAYGRHQTICYMRSLDAGKTWAKSDGTPVQLPGTADTLDVISAGGLSAGSVLQAGGLALGPDGVPLVAYSVQQNNEGHAYLARLAGGTWSSMRIEPAFDDDLRGYQVCEVDGIHVDDVGILTVLATLQNVTMEERDITTGVAWGHPTNEVVLLRGRANASRFEVVRLSDGAMPHPCWLPNMEAPIRGGASRPRSSIVFTAGSPGRSPTDKTQTRVFATNG